MSVCALESYYAPPRYTARKSARNKAGRGQRIERVPEEETNWLPTPESGPFSMKLRLFWLKCLMGRTPKVPRNALRSVIL